MRLYFSPASPFARKCRILIREKSLTARVEEIRADPIGGDSALNAVNPIGQVPALVDDAGVCWTDSPLICAYIDTLAAPRFIPEGEGRWDVLRREVLADGIMELGVKWRLEMVRPEAERSPSWMARWRDGVVRALDGAEQLSWRPVPLDLGAVAMVSALTWLDLRHAALAWREGRPKLAALQTTLEQRQSFRDTAPA